LIYYSSLQLRGHPRSPEPGKEKESECDYKGAREKNVIKLLKSVESKLYHARSACDKLNKLMHR